jgi:hypothetical protein
MRCPYCIHQYSFSTEIIVPESKVADVFYKIKSAHERVIYLKGYGSSVLLKLPYFNSN